jgi:hypothetical protein
MTRQKVAKKADGTSLPGFILSLCHLQMTLEQRHWTKHSEVCQDLSDSNLQLNCRNSAGRAKGRRKGLD